jgi:hypothetical protein
MSERFRFFGENIVPGFDSSAGEDGIGRYGLVKRW